MDNMLPSASRLEKRISRQQPGDPFLSDSTGTAGCTRCAGRLKSRAGRGKELWRQHAWFQESGKSCAPLSKNQDGLKELLCRVPGYALSQTDWTTRQGLAQANGTCFLQPRGCIFGPSSGSIRQSLLNKKNNSSPLISSFPLYVISRMHGIKEEERIML